MAGNPANVCVFRAPRQRADLSPSIVSDGRHEEGIAADGCGQRVSESVAAVWHTEMKQRSRFEEGRGRGN